MSNKIHFGVAGYPPNFFLSPYKKDRKNIFQWLKSQGLDWVELQSTYGVKMKKEQAIEYRRLAEDYKIGISVHAPYYISLASSDEGIVTRSKENIEKSFELASWLGSKRVIFHPGYAKGRTRGEGLKAIIESLNDLESLLPLSEGIRIYPEIGGKINALGSLEEILKICKEVSYAVPCLDLAHLHAREHGSLFEKDAFDRVFETVRRELGEEILKLIHIHMYPVEYNDTGERIHKAFGDLGNNGKRFGPVPEGLIDSLKEKHITPVIICEARDTQDEGALLMKQLFSSN